MVKITKTLARKMYNNGEEVMIIPNKLYKENQVRRNNEIQ